MVVISPKNNVTIGGILYAFQNFWKTEIMWNSNTYWQGAGDCSQMTGWQTLHVDNIKRNC